MHPKELRYSLEHVWIKDEGDNQFRLGLTYRYQEQIKSVVYLELPSTGSILKHDEPFGAIESSKISTDIISPINGTVIAANSAVLEKPGLINKDPYGAGWLLLIQASDMKEVTSLLTASEYLAAATGDAGAGPCQA